MQKLAGGGKQPGQPPSALQQLQNLQNQLPNTLQPGQMGAPQPNQGGNPKLPTPGLQPGAGQQPGQALAPVRRVDDEAQFLRAVRPGVLEPGVAHVLSGFP